MRERRDAPALGMSIPALCAYGDRYVAPQRSRFARGLSSCSGPRSAPDEDARGTGPEPYDDDRPYARSASPDASARARLADRPPERDGGSPSRDPRRMATVARGARRRPSAHQKTDNKSCTSAMSARDWNR